MSLIKNIYFLIIAAFLITLFPSHTNAYNFSNERLKYVISYKWGLIHKDAGEATLSLTARGNFYDISLTAKTKPWADKLYQVRDTLKGTLQASTLQPLSYEKLTHEKGEYKRDVIEYTYSGNQTIGNAKRYRNDNGKWKITEKTFSATGPVFDMLSVFYYLRQLDFSSMSSAKTYTATIFSGKLKETIKIQIHGKEKVKMKDKSEREAFRVKFNFTKEGGKKSSDDMNVWISTDPSHIPLYLVGKLPVGEVRAYLIS